MYMLELRFRLFKGAKSYFLYSVFPKLLEFRIEKEFRNGHAFSLPHITKQIVGVVIFFFFSIFSSAAKPEQDLTANFISDYMINY